MALRRLLVQGRAAGLRPQWGPTRAESTVGVTFVDVDGSRIGVQGKTGDSLLDTAHKHDVDVEGACGGELACSTCHVILDQEWYDKVEALSPKTEEEEDMLDLAWGLTPTSRLGCQIALREELEGLEITIPDESNDMQG